MRCKFVYWRKGFVYVGWDVNILVSWQYSLESSFFFFLLLLLKAENDIKHWYFSLFRLCRINKSHRKMVKKMSLWNWPEPRSMMRVTDRWLTADWSVTTTTADSLTGVTAAWFAREVFFFSFRFVSFLFLQLVINLGSGLSSFLLPPFYYKTLRAHRTQNCFTRYILFIYWLCVSLPYYLKINYSKLSCPIANPVPDINLSENRIKRFLYTLLKIYLFPNICLNGQKENWFVECCCSRSPCRSLVLVEAVLTRPGNNILKVHGYNWVCSLCKCYQAILQVIQV